MQPGEEQAVLALVLRTFDEFVRPDFSDEGAAEFTRSARNFVLEHPEGHCITVAVAAGRLVGMIDVRDGSHVCLFFVEGPSQRQGIGRALLSTALSRPAASAVTVNSGPSAVTAYQSLGFVATAPEAMIKGIRYVPMRRELTSGG